MKSKEKVNIFVNTNLLKIIWVELWLLFLVGFCTGIFLTGRTHWDSPYPLMRYVVTYVVPVVPLLGGIILPLGVLRDLRRTYTAIHINDDGMSLYYPLLFKKSMQRVEHYRKGTVKIKKYIKGVNFSIVVLILPDGKEKMLEVHPEAGEMIVRVFELEKEKNECGGA